MAKKVAAAKNGVLTVTTQNLIKVLKAAFTDASLVPCVFGPAGIGKSAITDQLAREYCISMLGVKTLPAATNIWRHLIDTRLGQLQEEDLTGLPKTEMLIMDPGESIFTRGDRVIEEMYWQEWYRCKRKNVAPPSGEGMTAYRLPSFFPKEGPAVWFFDEVNRARRGMLQCLFQLILDRKYLQYALPEGVRMCFAGNWSPQDAIYQVEELDPAFRSRMMMLYYTGPTYPEWKNAFALPYGIADEIVSFLGIHENLLLVEATDEKPQPNPRAWEKCSGVLKATGDSDARKVGLHGYIGEETAIMLLNYIEHEYEALPDPADLKRGAEIIGRWIRAKQNDKVTAFITSMVDFVEQGGGYEKKALRGFLQKLPKEYGFSLCPGLHKIDSARDLIESILVGDDTSPSSLIELMEGSLELAGAIKGANTAQTVQAAA